MVVTGEGQSCGRAVEADCSSVVLSLGLANPMELPSKESTAVVPQPLASLPTVALPGLGSTGEFGEAEVPALTYLLLIGTSFCGGVLFFACCVGLFFKTQDPGLVWKDR